MRPDPYATEQERDAPAALQNPLFAYHDSVPVPPQSGKSLILLEGQDGEIGDPWDHTLTMADYS